MLEEDGTEVFYFEVDDIRHMFVPPPRDAFSKQPYVLMGQSVVDRMLEHFRQEKGLGKKRHKLVLLMPPDKVTPGLARECEEAMDRFTATKVRDNINRMAAINRRGLLMIPYAMMFLVAAVGMAVIFGSEMVPGIPPVWASVLSEGLFIVAWVAMWGPLDTLLFGRFPLLTENRTLHALESTKVDVRPR